MAGNRSLVRSVRRHEVPAWWRDAKLGIFVHWTPSSVPGFAPTNEEIGDLLAAGRRDALGWSPYTEWYENSLRFPGSPVARYHAEVYGTKPYAEFIDDYQAGLAQWDPKAWARAFAATGARYVVFVSKHHDGYCLWPTSVRNPHRPGFHSQRDIVGELADAVRAEGLRFGLYYSGGLDWTFNDHPIGTMTDLLPAQPTGEYAAYARAHMLELIERYRPSLLWNDISWPEPVEGLASLLDHYYRAVPDGVANDRFMPRSLLWRAAGSAPGRRLLDTAISKASKKESGVVPPKPPLFDVRTPEYTVFDEVQHTPWECVRGMDKSFGFNAQSNEEHFLTRNDLLWTVVDIASKNGNLLLNVGPRGRDAQIPEPQLRRLGWLADAFGPGSDAGESLRGSRPFVTPGTRSAEGGDVRYVARDRDVIAFVRGSGNTVTLPELTATPTTSITVGGAACTFTSSTAGLQCTVPVELDADVPIAITARDVVASPTR